MLKSDLVTLVVARAGVPLRKAEEAVDQIFDSMRAALVRGEHIEIRGLGTFSVRKYGGYTGRNPKTAAAIEVKPKRGVLFRPGKDLRHRMNGGHPEATSAPSRAKKASSVAAANPTEHAA